MKPTELMIAALLPDVDDFYEGYVVEQISHMWWRVQLRHHDYTYKQGVLTDYCYVKSNGDVYKPGPQHKPSKDKVCTLEELYRQHPTSLVRGNGGSLLWML